MLLITWMLTLLGIIGVILNIYKIRACFLVWIAGNVGWMIVDFHYGVYAQSALFGIYLILAVIGYIQWGKGE